MSTSAIITNRTVRMRSLPDRPRRGLRAKSSAAAGRSVIEDALRHALERDPEEALRHAAISTEATQQTDDAPHPGSRQTRHEIGGGGLFSNLRQGRIRHHDTSKRADVGAAAHGERPSGDQLAGGGAHYGDAEDSAARIGHDLDVPPRLTLRMSAV